MEQPDFVQDSEVEIPAEESRTEAETPEVEIDPESTDTEDGATEDEEEVEYEGEKYKLPPKLKEALLRQADYTRKTQEVAEQRKQIEAQAADVQRQAKEHHEYVAEIAEVVAIDKQLQQYQQINWQQLIDTDPVQAMKLDRDMRALQEAKMQAAQRITHKQQQRALNEQQTFAKQVQEASSYLAREIKGWSDERSNQLLKYGTTEGIPQAELSRFTVQYPAIGKILHKAEMYDQLVKKQSTKPKPEAQEKPVTRIAASKSGTQKDPDKMSSDEWLKWRNAQVKRR